MTKKSTLFLILFLITINCWSQTQKSHFSTQSHSLQINNIVVSPTEDDFGSSFFSIGDDGFVIKWSSDGQGEHYQLSDVGIKMIACSPKKDLIAVYESDGGSVNKISVWDWNNLNRKYQKKIKDSVTSLQFSSNGTYIIVGTATVEGVRFFNSETGTEVNKIKENTGIVNYITTSKSEKTCALYSPTGTLSYYNLQTGKLKKKLNITKNLTNPVLYNDSMYLAGVKDGNIYIIDAIYGHSIASIPVNNPVILSTEADKDLYYLEYDGKEYYEIKMIESKNPSLIEDSKLSSKVSNPRLVKNIKGRRGAAQVNVGTKDSNFVYLGNKKGSIFKTEIDPSITTTYLTEIEITEDTYSKINGIAPAESDFYFLTDNSIYKSSYDTSIVEKIASTSGETDILPYRDNKVLLWSKNTRNAVSLLDLDTNEKINLFKPNNNIQSLSVSFVGNKNYIVDIEGYSSVNIYDFDKNNLKEIYSGTGVQDAVLTHDGNIYVAKTAASNPKVPLIRINMETLETVPIKNVNGNVVYALSTNGTIIYGIRLIETNNTLDTYVFSYHTLTGEAKNILKFPNEDSGAFTYLSGSYLFTNIGKDKVHCYNLNTKKFFSYDRSASMPMSVCKNGERVVILNYNGSISWCTPNNKLLIADWYLKNDEQWVEF